MRHSSRGPAPRDSLRSRLPLPLAELDSDLRREPPDQVDVEEGMQPGQLGDGGILRQAREQVLPPSGLVGRDDARVLPHARRLSEILQRGTAEEEAGLDEPDAVPQKPRAGRIAGTKKRPHPPRGNAGRMGRMVRGKRLGQRKRGPERLHHNVRTGRAGCWPERPIQRRMACCGLRKESPTGRFLEDHQNQTWTRHDAMRGNRRPLRYYLLHDRPQLGNSLGQPRRHRAHSRLELRNRRSARTHLV